MEYAELSTREKARRINLEMDTYGSFAEIGAGQEVAAFFFKSGGASNTIAKTMSAYDMTFSNAIYGAEESGRYVCESRLMKMLDKEYRLLEQRLGIKWVSNAGFLPLPTQLLRSTTKNQPRARLGRYSFSAQTPNPA
ncbi:MAG: hypothetical protein HC880_22440 [Bacteroidia bacterium]|nr:hypothetical protein [Bacteroidia bacterium]